MHRARWPEAGELAALARGAEEQADREQMALEVTAEVLSEVRKAKSQAKRPMRAPVERVIVHDTPERLDALLLGEGDLLQAGSIELARARRGRGALGRGASWPQEPEAQGT